jgi:diguanylate cyclase
MPEKQPVEILREAIMLLTTRKRAPTPANYQAVYHEVAGTPEIPPFPEERLREIAQALPVKNREQQKHKELFAHAVSQRDWDGLRKALVAYSEVDAPSPASAGSALAAPAESAPAVTSARGLTFEFMEQVARMVENTLPALGTDDTRFTEQVTHLVEALRTPSSEVATVKTMLANVSHRLSFVAEDQAEIKSILLKLLHLIFD